MAKQKPQLYQLVPVQPKRTIRWGWLLGLAVLLLIVAVTS